MPRKIVKEVYDGYSHDTTQGAPESTRYPDSNKEYGEFRIHANVDGRVVKIIPAQDVLNVSSSRLGLIVEYAEGEQ